MGTRQRRHETFTEQFIGSEFGAEVQHRDDGSTSGMVDALMRHPDGTVGALEVTTMEDPTVMEIESFDIHIDVSESRYRLDVRYLGPVLNRKQLEKNSGLTQASFQP